MPTFPEAFAAWEDAQRDAETLPSAATRLAAEQAHFALTHHPSAHHARAKVERGEQRRRAGR
jgi:hypothetical protein